MIEKTSLEKASKRTLDIRPLIAFFATLLAFAVVFAINGITPFGARNSLTSDLGAQYGPYLLGYRNALSGGESLLYSQGLGMGQNTLGVFAYYLSSPLNLMVFLFPQAHLQEFITILIMVKFAFAGAFMTWLLDRKFKDKDKMTILFGMLYPLCAFAIVFMFNIMWLDGFALLPLVVLMTEKFMDNRRCWPKLTILLLILFVSGYYMAYMIGIFAFLYLLCNMGYRGEFSKERQNDGVKKVGTFILSAVIAGMMSACVLIPAALDTLGNGDYTKSSGMNMDPTFPLLSLVDQFVEKGAADISKNLPFLFCGMTVLLLCILFFLNKSICKKLRIGIGIVFGFGIFSFHFPFLNKAWHLFDDPNWFRFRFSYLLTFVMILVAYYSYQHMKEAGRKAFLIATGIICGMLFISQSLGQMKETDNTFFATFALLILTASLFYGKTLEKWPEVIANLKRAGTLLLILVILVESVAFVPRCFMAQVFGARKDAPEFAEMVEDIQELASKEEQGPWYRSEIHGQWNSFLLPNTVPFYTNTQGISIFASMANKKTDHFLKQLGYRANYNYFSVEHMNSIMPADSILGIRYTMSTEHALSDLRYAANVGKYYLYENDCALPIAFLAQKEAASFDGYQLEKDNDKKDYFDFQEKWIGSLSGLDASDIYDTFSAEWEVLNGQTTDIQPSNALNNGDKITNTLNHEKKDPKNKALHYYLRNNTKIAMVLRTKITVDKTDPIYMVIPFMHMQCVNRVLVNDKEINSVDNSSYYSQILNLGSFQEGETIKVEIRTSDDVFYCLDPIFAYVNTSNVIKHTDALNAGVANVNVKNGRVSLMTSSDSDKLLVTTVPFEKGWRVCVDGQEVSYSAYQDAFICFPLSAGEHTVEMSFTSPGLKPGLLASGVGVLLFICISLLITRKKKETVAAREKDRTEAVKTENT